METVQRVIGWEVPHLRTGELVVISDGLLAQNYANEGLPMRPVFEEKADKVSKPIFSAEN